MQKLLLQAALELARVEAAERRVGYSGLNQGVLEWECESGGGLSSPEWGWASGDVYSEWEATTSDVECASLDLGE